MSNKTKEKRIQKTSFTKDNLIFCYSKEKDKWYKRKNVGVDAYIDPLSYKRNFKIQKK